MGSATGKASDLTANPHHNPLKFLLIACLTSFGWSVTTAQQHQTSIGPGALSTVPLVKARAPILRLPVVDGSDIRFIRLPTEDQVWQPKVSEIVQDNQGFMWFATSYGLYRYDGYTFKVFVHDPGNLDSLSGVAITALFKDRGGTLWIGCDQFLNKLNPETEAFSRYPVPFVTHISQDKEGTLWLATPSGLYGLDPTNGRISHFFHDPTNPSSLSSNHVIYSGGDRTGNLWVATPGHLDEFDRRKGTVTRHISIPETPYGFGFYQDRFGVFWIFHVSPNPLWAFDVNTNTLTRYIFPREPTGTAVTRVTTMLEDQEGTLWIGTHGPGLLKFDREHKRFIRYRNDPSDPGSIPQNDVDALFSDQEGSIWVGLGSMGPVRFTPKSPPFRRLFYAAGGPTTEDPFVGAIYEDLQGILWIGTPKALNRIDRKTRSVTVYRYGGPENDTDVIAIREDSSGALWVGTYGHGLLRFDRRTGKFKKYRLTDDFVSRLLVDHNGTLWAATTEGLSRFDPTTDSFRSSELTPHGDQPYLALAEDREGTLWLGADSAGLLRFDPATRRLAFYQQGMNRSGALSDNHVNSVYFDHTGSLWVGTQNGLNKFDRETMTFSVYTERNGLPGNAVGCILEDSHGYLWMSTNNGVARFYPQTGAFRTFSTADGLPGRNLIGRGACFKSANGEMFFGGFSGATAFFPDLISDSSNVPPVVLTSFRSFGIEVRPGSRSFLKKSINYNDSITLAHSQNTFSIQFSALSYLDSTTNRYRYRLNGLDHIEWNEVGSDQRVATYTTLPPGVYTFRVQGATSSGPWGEPGAQLRIEILPPWWGTLWFRATCSALLLLLGFIAYRYRLNQIANVMRARFDERLAERTRVAREFHDTFLQTVQGSKLVVDHALKNPNDHARMIRAVEQLSTWLGEATEQGRAALKSLRTSTTETNDLADALKRAVDECVRMQSSLEASFTAVGNNKKMHPVVRDEVYRIAYEAIRNACIHSGGRRLKVRLHYGQDLSVSMKDDGIGIDPTIAEKGRDGHFGLRGMKERAARIGGKLTILTSASSGTEITLVVPGRVIFRTARKFDQKG